MVAEAISTGTGGSAGVSIIIPTLNEAGNIGTLIEAVARQLSGDERRVESVGETAPQPCSLSHRERDGVRESRPSAFGLQPDSCEIIVVDDGSRDGTQEEVKRCAETLPVRLVERGRKMGLASAIVAGAAAARYDVLLVMDADGSHPVSAIPALLEPVMAGRVHMSIGSRYAPGGRTEGWPLRRLIISRLATLAASPIAPVADPLSGFFAVRKSRVPWDALRPRGFKIGLEIMCRSLFDDVAEVPIVFRDREAGRSKAGMNVMLAYAVQLLLLAAHMLRRGRFPLAQFTAVGVGGMLVDYAVFEVLHRAFGMPPVHSQALSFVAAVLNNFYWNRRWTFMVSGTGAAGQLVRFVLVAVYALLFRSILVYWLAESVGAWPELALLAGIVAATAVNYIGSARFAFHEAVDLAAFGWLLVGFLLFLKLLYGSVVDLAPEEAYYWNYAKHPALSYLDHPPLLAWTLLLSTSLFGDTEFAVRLVGLAYALAACAGLYLVSRDWYGRQAAGGALVAYMLLPYGFAYSFLATPEAPLLAMCFLAAWAAGRTAMSGDNRWFLLVGLFGGLGALSKYTVAVLLVGLLAYGLCERRLARWLKSGWVWLGVLVAAALFAPIVVWNWQHQWASFGFQLSRRLLSPEEAGGHPLRGVAMYAGYHLGFVTPLVLCAGVWGLWRLIRRRRREDRLFLCCGLAFVLLFLLYSLRAAPKPNWTLPGILLLSPAVYAALKDATTRAGRVLLALVRWSLLLLAFVYAAGMYHLAFLLPGVPPVRKLDGWREFGAAVADRQRVIKAETGRQPLIIGADRYHWAAEAAFYAPAANNAAGVWALGHPHALSFRYWLKLADFAGADALYLARRSSGAALASLVQERLAEFAEHVDAAEEVEARVGGRVAGRFWFVRLRGYRPPPE